MDTLTSCLGCVKENEKSEKSNSAVYSQQLRLPSTLLLSPLLQSPFNLPKGAMGCANSTATKQEQPNSKLSLDASFNEVEETGAVKSPRSITPFPNGSMIFGSSAELRYSADESSNFIFHSSVRSTNNESFVLQARLCSGREQPLLAGAPITPLLRGAHGPDRSDFSTLVPLVSPLLKDCPVAWGDAAAAALENPLALPSRALDTLSYSLSENEWAMLNETESGGNESVLRGKPSVLWDASPAAGGGGGSGSLQALHSEMRLRYPPEDDEHPICLLIDSIGFPNDAFPSFARPPRRESHRSDCSEAELVQVVVEKEQCIADRGGVRTPGWPKCD
jgi:hypothetical protein